MKISNETKVGILAAVSIVMLIFGLNLLKGKNLFSSSKEYYATFKKASGLNMGSAVQVKGYQIGSVTSVQASNDLSTIKVGFKLKKDYAIPDNSVCFINTSIPGLSAPIVDIVLGNSTNSLKVGGSLQTNESPGLLSGVQDQLNPVLAKVQTSLGSLDTLLRNTNKVIDESARQNLQAILGNVNGLTNKLNTTANSLNTMLGAQGSALNASLNNVESITKNMAANNETITSTLTNIKTTTQKFSELDLATTLNKLNETVTGLKTMMDKLNSPNGSLGKILNDDKLYNQISQTMRSVNTLVDDLKMHPKRYVGISVFGKKDRTKPLAKPLYDSTKTN
jgi:phospholipid/cholesterol/gamma-HCH transport system substrate-binding protein